MTRNTHFQGLTPNEVEQNRTKYGSNEFTEKEKTPIWQLFLDKFHDPIIVILLIALAASFGIAIYEYTTKGHLTAFFEPMGILIAILLATGVGFFFEMRANAQFEILNQVNEQVYYKVIRQGHVVQVLKKDIVVGDVVLIETGEEIPADGTLLQAISLQINESSLTGEPLVHKTILPEEFEHESTYPSNYVCRGTAVMDGHGIFKVEKVGDSTEYGKVFLGVQIDSSVQTPLTKQLNGLANIITKVSYVLACLILVGRMLLFDFSSFEWLHFGSYLLNTIMIAVTIIVVTVPEGLPMSVTLSLAYSMRAMMKTNNLVRKMHACETMGATTVICTDKTGTLTQNQMRIYEVFGNNFSVEENSPNAALLTEAIAVNTTAYLNLTNEQIPQVLGNPTEGALLLWLHQVGKNFLTIRENTTVVEQLPFSTERKLMATLVKSKVLNKYVLYVKGAPEIIMELCYDTNKQFNSEISEKEFQAKLTAYQAQAMRTIGFAYKTFDSLPNKVFSQGKITEQNLQFMGITAIADPIRSDVPAAIAQCITAGIDIKIVTGDTPGTAKEIARQIGLWDTTFTEANHISGSDLAMASDEQLKEILPKIKVISRAKPLDKARLVRLLQEMGQVVAVTGDGTNDAPALKAAQVGLSMGDGTSVAKEASDITILDNSFSSIGKAVMWGRSLYINIQRFILFQMTINVTACIIVVLGAFLGTQTPLTVTQMLWINLIMDTFAALALASLPPSIKVLNNAPRKQTDSIISRSMAWQIFSVGIIFVVFLFGLIQYFKHVEISSLVQFSWQTYFENYFNFTPTHNSISLYEQSLFFSIFVFLQFWNIFNAKAYLSGKSAFIGMLTATNFIIIAWVILLGQVLITTLGGQMFSVMPLQSTDWAIIIISTSAVLWIGETFRAIKK